MDNLLKVLAEKKAALDASRQNAFAMQLRLRSGSAPSPIAQITKPPTIGATLPVQKDRSRSPRREQHAGNATNSLGKKPPSVGLSLSLSDLLKGQSSATPTPALPTHGVTNKTPTQKPQVNGASLSLSDLLNGPRSIGIELPQSTTAPQMTSIPTLAGPKGPTATELAMAQLLAGPPDVQALAPGGTQQGQSQKHVIADNCRGNLVKQWRQLSKPKGRAPTPAQDIHIPAALQSLQGWFEQRNLTQMLQPDALGSVGGWLRFSYTSAQAVQAGANWQPALHGTWWYALWQILTSGILLESTDESKGHEYQIPGVYVTIDQKLADSYARPQVLFNDGVYYKVMLDVRVDMSRKKQRKKTKLEQWVFPPEAIAIVGILVRPGTKVEKGEERFDGWQDDLEVRPAESGVDGGFMPWLG